MSAVSVSQAKAYLRVTHSSDDALLQRLINSAEDEALAYLDRASLPRRGEFVVDEADSNTPPLADVDVSPAVLGGIYLLVQAMYEGKDAAEMAAVREVVMQKCFPYRNALGL